MGLIIVTSRQTNPKIPPLYNYVQKPLFLSQPSVKNATIHSLGSLKQFSGSKITQHRILFLAQLRVIKVECFSVVTQLHESTQ
jgi:hypothetical protein